MKIGRFFFPVHVLGYGKRLGLWTSGCPFLCDNCISKELRSEENGVDLSIQEIITLIKRYDKADGITISGGEPFLQVNDLYTLICSLLEIGMDDIILYSGFYYEELKNMRSSEIDFILDNVACLILGRYEEELNNGKGIVGSSNQQVVINKYNDRHNDVRLGKREQQIVFSDDRMVVLGVAPKETK